MAHKVSLSWTPSAVDATHDGAVSYNIKRAVKGSSNFLVIGTSTTPSFVDTDVKAGDSFDYEVTGINPQGESVPCPVVTAATIPFLIPGAPSALVAISS